MIVVLCNLQPEAPENGFHVTPDLSLLNKAYIDRLADQYRSLGAKRVYWSGADYAPKTVEEFPADMRTSEDDRVLAADIRLWPGNELHRLFDLHQDAASECTAYVRPIEPEYTEIIEKPQAEQDFAVRRKYSDSVTIKRTHNCLALLFRPRGYGWRMVKQALSEARTEYMNLVAPEADQHAQSTSLWIESPADYLQLTEHLLTEYAGDEPEVEAVGNRIWTHPGTVIAENALLEGPILLGRNCRIESGARIVGPAFIGDDTTVGQNCCIRESVIMNGGVLQPMAKTYRSVTAPKSYLHETRGIAHCWFTGNEAKEDISHTHKALSNVVVPTEQALPAHLHVAYRFIKRTIDLAGAATGLAATLPLYPLIAAAIKIESPGPVFYVHRRQTLGGKEFGCIKFRSMVDNAHLQQKGLKNQVDGPQFHMENDPRLTKVGRFLRTTNLDEVPQFWNILLGHMSLVGPRPSPDNENQYCPAWREARLSVRPGLTGLWQIKRSTNRSAGDFHEWIMYDVQYLKNCSLRLDLKVLYHTTIQMFKKINPLAKNCKKNTC